MEVLRSNPISEKAAAKLLKKFVASKQESDNADVMMTEEVQQQLSQVLQYLDEKERRASKH